MVADTLRMYQDTIVIYTNIAYMSALGSDGILSHSHSAGVISRQFRQFHVIHIQKHFMLL